MYVKRELKRSEVMAMGNGRSGAEYSHGPNLVNWTCGCLELIEFFLRNFPRPRCKPADVAGDERIRHRSAEIRTMHAQKMPEGLMSLAALESQAVSSAIASPYGRIGMGRPR